MGTANELARTPWKFCCGSRQHVLGRQPAGLELIGVETQIRIPSNARCRARDVATP